MGVFSRRDKLLENARPHLDAGESVKEAGLVRVGVARQQNHALIATDRNLYRFRLGWPGFSRIVETVGTVPLQQAGMELTATRVHITDASNGEVVSYQLLPGRRPEKLVDYVNGQAHGRRVEQGG